MLSPEELDARLAALKSKLVPRRPFESIMEASNADTARKLAKDWRGQFDSETMGDPNCRYEGFF